MGGGGRGEGGVLVVCVQMQMPCEGNVAAVEF